MDEGYNLHFLFSTSVVTIGFNGTYSVQEGSEGFTIVVLVLMNSLARDVVVTLSTLDDTAIGRFAQCPTCMERLPISSCMQLRWTTHLYLEI